LGVLKDGFHDRLLIFVLRPFFQILALLATLIENAARSQFTYVWRCCINEALLCKGFKLQGTSKNQKNGLFEPFRRLKALL
jgi:hypothetical protein